MVAAFPQMSVLKAEGIARGIPYFAQEFGFSRSCLIIASFRSLPRDSFPFLAVYLSILQYTTLPNGVWRIDFAFIYRFIHESAPTFSIRISIHISSKIFLSKSGSWNSYFITLNRVLAQQLFLVELSGLRFSSAAHLACFASFCFRCLALSLLANHFLPSPA